MEDKKYYWLKLKRDFFKRHDIMIIESMPNGKDYILFYLKLLCESVDHDGKLRFNETVPYNEEMLSTITNTNVDIVKSAINVFSQLKMIDITDNGTYFMNEVQKMLGTETYWAEIKRKQRNVEELDNVQQLSIASPKCPSKSIDIDKELDIYKKKDKDIVKILCQEILDYLNIKTSRKFTLTDTHLKYIKVRLEEGHTLEEFKQVIDIMCDKWLSDVKYSQYLRPQTLFGTKFESYLNSAPKPKDKIILKEEYQPF